ncbi:hypothetical protein [Roseobacter sp. HKCC-CH-9351]|uniref:hypothetical protein n=1 Tax=Roseobacter sp. HKCC-CH-9351 TaxID=3120341 RepID=UPI0030EDC8A3
MKSSESNREDNANIALDDWLEELHSRLGATQELMESYLSRDDSYFTKLAADTKNTTVENSPEEIQQANRRLVLKQLIHVFRPLKKVLKHLDEDLPLAVIDRLVEELWEIERGGRNWLLVKPLGMGRGNRPAVTSSVHRALLVCAYDKMIAEGCKRETAVAHIADRTGLAKSTISSTVKDFKEGAKDQGSLTLYKELSGQDHSSETFLMLFNKEHLPQRG